MARQISREEYERLFGAAQSSAVDDVAGHYLAEQAFDEAYARLVTKGFSHEDAVRGAQQHLYGQVRSLSVGAQGPENRRAVADYMARARASEGQVPLPYPVAEPPAAERMAGGRLARVLGGSALGGGALLGALIELLSSEEEPVAQDRR